MKKNILVGILMMLLFVSTVTALTELIIRNTAGTDIFVLKNATGNLNITTGIIAETGVALSDRYYLQTAIDTAGEMSAIWSISIANQTYVDAQDSAQDECSEITNCVDNAWDALSDMVLADGSIYIGDVSNDPAAQAVSGDATITNAGVVSVIDTAGLGGENITSGLVADARIASTIARDTEVVAANTSMKNYADTQDSAQDECSEIGLCIPSAFNSITNFTGTLTDTYICVYDSANTEIDCATNPASLGGNSSAEIMATVAANFNATPLDQVWSGTGILIRTGALTYGQIPDSSANWNASYTAFNANHSSWDSALQNVVEDTTPQLGGTLDANAQDIQVDTGNKVCFDGATCNSYVNASHVVLIRGSGTFTIYNNGTAGVLEFS